MPRVVNAKIKTSQPRFIVNERAGTMEISATEPAENDRANREIVKELSKLYGACRILKGARSNKKLLEVG